MSTEDDRQKLNQLAKEAFCLNGELAELQKKYNNAIIRLQNRAKRLWERIDKNLNSKGD